MWVLSNEKPIVYHRIPLGMHRSVVPTGKSHAYDDAQQCQWANDYSPLQFSRMFSRKFEWICQENDCDLRGSLESMGMLASVFDTASQINFRQGLSSDHTPTRCWLWRPQNQPPSLENKSPTTNRINTKSLPNHHPYLLLQSKYKTAPSCGTDGPKNRIVRSQPLEQVDTIPSLSSGF